MIPIVVLVIVILISTIYLWSRTRANFWVGKNVPFLPAKPFVGNFEQLVLQKKSVSELFKEWYMDERVKDAPVAGISMLTQPALLIRDPELIRDILIKDFNIFSTRFETADPHDDKLSAYSLFFLKNVKMWKQMRSKLTPFFTSAKLKQMFYLINNIAIKFDQHLCKLKDGESIEIREYAARYGTDIIASCAFGLEVNSIDNPTNNFRVNGEKMFNPNFSRIIDFISVFFVPSLVKIFKLKFFEKDASKFMSNTFSEVLREREKLKIARKDLIDIMIEWKNDDSLPMKENIDWCDEILVSQPAIFFAAGFETTSTTISFALYELAKNPEIQQTLRNEIRNVLEDCKGELNYDNVMGMQYLDSVISETLRMWPPVPFTDRECGDPNGYSLKQYGINYKIPQGMPCYISIYGLLHDPNHFPEPETFNPERFSVENKGNIRPYTYLPFGSGPHNCIGDRFALISSKIGVVNVLKNHRIELASENEKYLKMSTKTLIMRPENGINIRLIKDKLITS